MSAGFWVLGGTWFQAVLRLAVVTILARLLGPADFGVAAAALVVIGFFRIFLRTGVRPAVVQRPEMAERHIRTAFALSMYIGVAFAIVVAVGADAISRATFDMPELGRILQVLALMLPLQSLGTVATALLERELRFDRVMRIEVISYIVGYGFFGLSLAFAGYGVWALVAAYLVQEGCRTGASLLARPHPKSLRVERRAAREIIYFGTGFSVARIGNWAALNGDNWVVGRWLGQEALGFYKYAYELTGMIANVFAAVLDRVLFPAMARVQSDPVRLAAAYRRGVALVSLVVFPTSAMIIVLAPELILGVLGEGWESVVGPFRVLAAVLLIRATYKVSDSMARATGAVYRRAWRQSIYAVAVIGFAWVGQHWGLTAVAVGVGLGIFVNFLLMAQLSLSLAELHWRDVVVAHLGAAPSFAITLGLGLGISAIVRPLAYHPIFTLLIVALAAGLLLGVILRFTPRLLLGPDGIGALRMLVDFLATQAPGVTRSRWFVRLLPRVLTSR